MELDITTAQLALQEMITKLQHLGGDVAQLHDGYHSFAELYNFRMLYNAMAANSLSQLGIKVVKSLTHSDGNPCFGGGWFVVVIYLPGGQVTNHYKLENDNWNLFKVPEELPEPYDGHTPQDCVNRMRDYLLNEHNTATNDEHGQ